MRGARAALYLRLSHRDGGGEGESIANQRALLRAYAREQGFQVAGEYVDSGWSGTRFDRPAFRRLLSDVEAGAVDVVLTKDLSRLGRDYIAAGQYAELYFPAHGVRYIAVNDGYDSLRESDIAPFKNVVNEMYARDISRKIRSALAVRRAEGRYLGSFAPYGYQKDPDDRGRLRPEAHAAQVVKEIFASAAGGEGTGAIARRLNARGEPSPGRWRCLTHPGLREEDWVGAGCWTAAAVRRILDGEVYLGRTVQGKSAKRSFRAGTAVRRAPEDWVRVEGTHPALVTPEMFAAAHRARRRSVGTGFHNELSGLLRCAGCGGPMAAVSTRKKGSPAALVCARYKRAGPAACSSHRIDYAACCRLLREALAPHLALTEEETAALRPAERDAESLACARSRLEGRLERLYEDRAAGRLGEEAFRALLERTQGRLAALGALDRPAEGTQSVPDLRAWLDGPLDGSALRALVEEVRVEQGAWVREEQGRVWRQRVEVFLRFPAPPLEREIAL